MDCDERGEKEEGQRRGCLRSSDLVITVGLMACNNNDIIVNGTALVQDQADKI